MEDNARQKLHRDGDTAAGGQADLNSKSDKSAGTCGAKAQQRQQANSGGECGSTRGGSLFQRREPYSAHSSKWRRIGCLQPGHRLPGRFQSGRLQPAIFICQVVFVFSQQSLGFKLVDETMLFG